MKILVLGGNGYLGSKLVRKFAENGNKCFASCLKGSDIKRLDGIENIEIVDSSLTNIERLIIVNKIDLIVNTVCRYQKSENNFSDIIESNLIYPLSLFSFAVSNNVKNILTIDTSLPKDLNVYSFSKKSLAEYGAFFCRNKYDLSFTNVILENFYGEDEPKDRFLHITLDKLYHNQNILLTAGTQRRDFIYIDDVVNAIDLLVIKKKKGYLDVPLGTGEGPTIREVVEFLKEKTQSKSKLIFGAIPSRKNEPSCIANLDVLEKLGFAIQYPWKIGVLKLLRKGDKK